MAEKKRKNKHGRKCLTCIRYPKECKEGTVIPEACINYRESADKTREIFRDGNRV